MAKRQSNARLTVWGRAGMEDEMKSSEEIKKAIGEGKTALGIEFGSTRIKAVLVTEDNVQIGRAHV